MVSLVRTPEPGCELSPSWGACQPAQLDRLGTALSRENAVSRCLSCGQGHGWKETTLSEGGDCSSPISPSLKPPQNFLDHPGTAVPGERCECVCAGHSRTFSLPASWLTHCAIFPLGLWFLCFVFVLFFNLKDAFHVNLSLLQNSVVSQGFHEPTNILLKGSSVSLQREGAGFAGAEAKGCTARRASALLSFPDDPVQGGLAPAAPLWAGTLLPRLPSWQLGQPRAMAASPPCPAGAVPSLRLESPRG